MAGDFKSITVEKTEDGTCAVLGTTNPERLPPGDTLVEVEYTGLNYKDALALTGRGRVLRNLPIIPGIDLAGRVVSTTDSRFQPGDSVFATGWGIGEERSGGFAQQARVNADWLHRLPEGWDNRTVMAFGTAGLTAMLCINALERHGIDRSGEVLVTGAGGGVGGIALAALAKLGYAVAASTGRAELADNLKTMGASAIVSREELSEGSRPLLGERWSAAVDSVGGRTLANVLAATRYGGAVAACGLAGGGDLPATVMPFILRNVALLGVDSVRARHAAREHAWRKLAELFPDKPPVAIEETDLDGAQAAAFNLLDGKVNGRVVVRAK